MTSNADTLPEEYRDGYVYFLGKKFFTDARALIPRIETETLVLYCRELLKNTPSISTVVDIGTGTGIITISLAMNAPEVQFYAIDKSSGALSLAKENLTFHSCQIHQMQNSYRDTSPPVKGDACKAGGCKKIGNQFETDITFLQGNLLSPLIHLWRDNTPSEILITANLPYVRTKEINAGLTHEPRMALDGGKITGFELYERFFTQIFSWKNRPKTCHIVVEFGLWQRDICETFLLGKDCSYSFFSDLRGIERFAHIVM